MKYEVISDDGSSSSNDLRKAGIMDFSSYSLSHTHSLSHSLNPRKVTASKEFPFQ
jgi:hypothetical protein